MKATTMINRPCLIVCERRGHWAAAVRRHLPGDFRLRETRSPGECRNEMAAAPASLVVVEATPANLAAAIELVAEASARFPRMRIAAVADRSLEACGWLLREAGAIHFTASPRDADVLARMAQRHAARLPGPPTAFAAEIWDLLPWGEAAAS